MSNIFNSSPFGPYGSIPGQAPKLITQRRHAPRIDTSAFSRLSQMPKPNSPLQPVGSVPPKIANPVADFPVRVPEQVVSGLGLPFDVERELIDNVREWIQRPDPISFRRSLYKGLRSFAPNDYMRRNEIAKRVTKLWKSAIKASPYERNTQHAIVQKSIEKKAAREQQVTPPMPLKRMMRLQYRDDPTLDDSWMTSELDNIENVELNEQPPGWPDSTQLKKAPNDIKPIYPSKKAFIDKCRAKGLNPNVVNLDALNDLLGIWSIPTTVKKAGAGAMVSGHKYIRRERKPGGGYRYIYEETAEKPTVKTKITENELEQIKDFFRHEGKLSIDEHRALSQIANDESFMVHEGKKLAQAKRKTTDGKVLIDYFPVSDVRKLYKKGLVAAQKFPGGMTLISPTRLGYLINAHHYNLSQREWGSHKYRGWKNPRHRPEYQDEIREWESPKEFRGRKVVVRKSMSPWDIDISKAFLER